MPKRRCSPRRGAMRAPSARRPTGADGSTPLPGTRRSRCDVARSRQRRRGDPGRGDRDGKDSRRRVAVSRAVAHRRQPSADRAGRRAPDRRDRAEGRRRRRPRRAAARPPRADPPVAVRRQHDRQGRHRHPLRRPRLSRQVRERARPPADRIPPRRDRRRRRRPARLRLAPAPVATRLRAGAAGRRGRRPLPDAVRRLPLLQRDRRDAGVRADGRRRRARRGAGGAAGRARARGHRRARRLRDAAHRLDRLEQLRRALHLLLRARPRHRRGRVVEDLAAAQPDRLRRHLHRRDGVGRAQVPARGLRHQPGVPDRLLPALRRHPRPAGAPARRAPRPPRARPRRTATRGSTAACCSACRR